MLAIEGVVVRGNHLASGWMARDPLYTQLFAVGIHPGTINVIVDAGVHPALGGSNPLGLGAEGVDPRHLRAMRRILYRRCVVNDTGGFVLRAEGGETQTMLEIVTVHLPDIRYGGAVRLALDVDGEPDSLPVPSR